MKVLIVAAVLLAVAVDIEAQYVVNNIPCGFRNNFCQWKPDLGKWSFYTNKYNNVHAKLDESEGEIRSPTFKSNETLCMQFSANISKNGKLFMQLEDELSKERITLWVGQNLEHGNEVKFLARKESRLVIRGVRGGSDYVAVRDLMLWEKDCYRGRQG